MSERDKKDHGEDSAKQVTSRWFARHSLVDIRDVKLYHPDVFLPNSYHLLLALRFPIFVWFN